MKRLHTGSLNKRRLLITMILLTAAASLLYAGYTAARYVLQQRQDGIAGAQEFYFTSDLLRDVSENARYYIDPGAADFHFTLSNSADSLRHTSADIQYTVEAAGGSLSVTSGSLKGQMEDSAMITVTPIAGADEITVTASASAPYAASLSATFISARGNYYSVADQSGSLSAVLTMTCTDSARDIALVLPNGVIPDATDSRVSVSDSGGYTFHSPGYGVYSIVLLKSNAAANLSKSETAFADRISLAL